MNSRTKTFIISEPDEGKDLMLFWHLKWCQNQSQVIYKINCSGLVTVDGAKVKSGYV